MIKKANEFISENKNIIDKTYRENYHFMADIGWINDANGFIYFRGEYHLFFQYYPYKGICEVAYWGHAKSKDLIHWKQLPIALAPDQDYDRDGCWSGSSIVIDGVLWLIYTGNKIIDGKTYQTQNLAYSTDGINFTKYIGNPVIQIDEDFSYGNLHEFRDPFIFKDHKIFKVLLGTKQNEKSKLLQFSSKDIKNWKFDGVAYSNDDLGTMFECPNLPTKNILVVSPQNIPARRNEFWNVSSVVGFIGRYDGSKFNVSSYQELDHGMEFYAPQLRKIKGRILMIPWMQMWGRRYLTKELNHKWQNAFALIRELKIENNHLYQTPIRELKKYVSKPKKVVFGNDPYRVNLSSKIHLEFASDISISIIFKDESNEFVISYSKDDSLITIDRSRCKEQLNGVDNTLATKGIRKVGVKAKHGKIAMDIYLDRISLEIFINRGEETMSSLCYFNHDFVDVICEGTNLYAQISIIKI